MKKILSHQVDLGPSMLDVKYKELGGSGLVTTPLNTAPNLSECNVSHAGIAQLYGFGCNCIFEKKLPFLAKGLLNIHVFLVSCSSTSIVLFKKAERLFFIIAWKFYGQVTGTLPVSERDSKRKLK